jgi:hypothetical protein
MRRRDHKKAISESPLSLFESVISDEISKNSAVNFYVASDSEEEKQYLKQIFGSRIITKLESSDRRSIQGMQAALVDLYTLSKTCKIYGSSGSSFSQTAADISGINIVKLVKSENMRS